MNIKEKEIQVKELLSEMKLAEVKAAGFTDLLIKVIIENHYSENIERWGSNGDILLPAPVIVTDEVKKTSLTSFSQRLNDINLEKAEIKNGILSIVYESKKQISISLENLKGIFIMRKGDTHVY